MARLPFLPWMLLAVSLVQAGCDWRGPGPAASAPAAAPDPAPAPSEEDDNLPAVTPAEESPTPLEAPLAPPAADSPKPAAEATELLRDTFADAEGAIHWNRDGTKSAEGPVSNRTIYFFNGMPEGGPLVMRMAEEHSLSGPDGQPGVLALSWQEIPSKLPYSGFTYQGGREAAARLILPPLKQAKSADDLRPFRLSFRWKGLNERREGPFNLAVGCRLEPMLADSYRKRLDLGTLVATSEWTTVEIGLGDGTNTEEFFRAVAEESPPSFKIIWAQTGPLANYQSGDTLLIDDLVITQQAPQ